VLPGSKSVQADLAWLRAQGFDAAILRHLRYGGKVIGLCGGFQMLGRKLHDPAGIEGKPDSIAGLGLFDCETALEAEKQLKNVSGWLKVSGGDTPPVPMSGYEIHMGVTRGPALATPAVEFDDDRVDGVMSENIIGTYCHGLFDRPKALTALLAWAGAQDIAAVDLAARREADLDRLADAVNATLDWARLDF
jgi:adenosylcobyric acid synthase